MKTVKIKPKQRYITFKSSNHTIFTSILKELINLFKTIDDLYSFCLKYPASEYIGNKTEIENYLPRKFDCHFYLHNISLDAINLSLDAINVFKDAINIFLHAINIKPTADEALSSARSQIIDIIIKAIDKNRNAYPSSFYKKPKITPDKNELNKLKDLQCCPWYTHISCYIEIPPLQSVKIKVPIIYLIKLNIISSKEIRLSTPVKAEGNEPSTQTISLADLELKGLEIFDDFKSSMQPSKTSLYKFVKKYYARFYKPNDSDPTTYIDPFKNLLLKLEPCIPIMSHPDKLTEKEYIELTIKLNKTQEEKQADLDAAIERVNKSEMALREAKEMVHACLNEPIAFEIKETAEKKLAEARNAKSIAEENLKKDDIYKTFFITKGIAKFIYIYLAYRTWKYNSVRTSDPIQQSIKYINEIAINDDSLDGYASNKNKVAGDPSYIFFDYKIEDLTSLQTTDNTSIGSFFTPLASNGQYCDEFNTLLNVNSELAPKEVTFIPYIWRSRLWTETRSIIKQNPIPPSKICEYAITEHLYRVYSLLANANLATKSTMNDLTRCIMYFFTFQANKHSKLTFIIRKLLFDGLGAGLPSLNAYSQFFSFIYNNQSKVIGYLNTLVRRQYSIYPNNHLYNMIVQQCPKLQPADNDFKAELIEKFVLYINSTNINSTNTNPQLLNTNNDEKSYKEVKGQLDSVLRTLGPFLLDIDDSITEKQFTDSSNKENVIKCWWDYFTKAIFVTYMLQNTKNTVITNIFKKTDFEEDKNSNLNKRTFSDLALPSSQKIRKQAESLFYLSNLKAKDYISNPHSPFSSKEELLKEIDFAPNITCLNIPLINSFTRKNNIILSDGEHDILDHLRQLIQFYAIQHYISWYIPHDVPLEKLNSNFLENNIKYLENAIAADLDQILEYLREYRTTDNTPS